jgi:hypothetical protein
VAAPTDLEFLARVLLATGCGALIGLERQYRSRTAGLRTQALVAAGAATFVLFGEQVGSTTAPLQITAYVASGVGFLGGGVILRQGLSVQGLNTAATLWCSAAIGCQAAAGHVIPALMVTGIVLAVNAVTRYSAGKDSTGSALDQVGVEMLIEGDARTLLDGLVTGLSVEPGVHAISWPAEDTATGSDDDNDDRPEQNGTRRRTWWRPTPPTD